MKGINNTNAHYLFAPQGTMGKNGNKGRMEYKVWKGQTNKHTRQRTDRKERKRRFRGLDRCIAIPQSPS
jgi:hypothetical protein